MKPPCLRTLRSGAGLLAPLVLLAWLGPARAQDCRSLESMLASFRTVYPTGAVAERVSGEPGRRVMRELGERGPGAHVAFLYSGDGPVTGARGRYLYLVLDGAECILRHDWIDGEEFDRVLTAR